MPNLSAARPLVLVLGASAAVGVLLAQFRAVAIGFVLMLIAAFAMRRRWIAMAYSAPGSPERALWIGFSAQVLIGAYLAVSLYGIGPEMQLHTSQVHAFARSVWTLVAGALVAFQIARDPEPRSDERDVAITQLGNHAGYWVLSMLVLLILLGLSFLQQSWVLRLSHAAISHGLILVLTITNLVDYGARLHAYLQDRAAQAALSPDEPV